MNKSNITLKTLVFIKKCKTNALGKSPLFLRISIGTQRAEIALKRSIEPNLWDSKRQCITGRNDEARSINDQIQTYKTIIYNHYTSFVANGDKFITPTKLKNAFLGIDEKKKTLQEAFEYHNLKMEEKIDKGISKGTFEKYVTCFSHLKSFMALKYNKDVFLNCIDLKFITEFEHYLRVGKKCCNNTAVKYVKNFKKIIKMALGFAWIEKDPFINYKAKLDNINKEILTEQELELVRNKEFTMNRLQHVKDIFVFSCFTGLAYADVQKLTNNNIVKGIDGNNWIIINRTKTNVSSRIPLLPPAEEILQRYADNPICKAKGVLLPVLSNQKMNAYLKEIADCCEINKNLTFHVARHTFATTVAISNRVPMETLSKMMGHTSIKYTQHYGKINDMKINEDISYLRSKYSSIETSRAASL